MRGEIRWEAHSILAVRLLTRGGVRIVGQQTFVYDHVGPIALNRCLWWCIECKVR